MKSYIFKITSLLLFFSFISCSDSSEDDRSFTLVGEWSRTMDLLDGVNVLNDCQARDIINFKSDGTFIGTYYYEDTPGECELNEIQNGTWELINDGILIDNDRLVRIEIIDNNKINLGNYEDENVSVFVRI